MRELGLMLQESEVRPVAVRTLGGFLMEKMDVVDGERRRRTVKRRLRLRCIVCCGAAARGSGSPAINFHDGDEEENDYRYHQPREATPINPEVEPSPVALSDLRCVSSGMNLAEALAAERHFRVAPEPERHEFNAAGGTETDGRRTMVSLMRLLEGEAAGGAERNGRTMAPEEPLRVSLMRLLEEAEESSGGRERRSETACCVCMIREKGAAFIPCGHTFCRICSRQLWLNRRSCPLCNRSIIEILDIF